LKSILLFVIALFFVISPAFGQLSLSDATGLINRLDVETSGHVFEIKLVSNFDLTDYEFEKDEKQLTLYLESGLEDNLAEIILPRNLLSGNFIFYLDGEEFFPKINSNEKIHFITMKFSGIGSHVISISGTEYLVGLDEVIPIQNNSSETSNDDFLPPNGKFDTTPSDNNLVWLIVGGIVVAIVVVVAIKFVKK